MKTVAYFQLKTFYRKLWRDSWLINHINFWITIVKVEVVGGGDCGRVEGGSTSSLSQRKRAQREQPSAVSKLVAGSQWKSKLSQAESGLGWGKWPLLPWGSAPPQIKTKTGGEIAADSPLGPGQGLGQGLWRTRSISRRWSRLKATQSGDPVWGEIMKLILGLLLLLGVVLAEDEDCPDFDCPVKDGSFAVSILDLAP